uniref:BPTI/Kunitz inhibitor domain-containing protein n=1 Tax=Heterorhabditis bacteriophora TaxID=37862 RepID=A0A1I7X339_HETBA
MRVVVGLIHAFLMVFAGLEDRCLDSVDPGPCQYYQNINISSLQQISVSLNLIKLIVTMNEMVNGGITLIQKVELFFYYGCGGNDNKFYSQHLCHKVCAEKLSPQIACETCDIRTSFCKSHSKYNYTCECRIGYEKNRYGDCIGQ